MMSFARSRAGFRGFTLVEMMVSIGIVGVLSAVIGVVCVKGRAESRAMACISNQKAISQALVTCFAEKRELPSDGSNLAVELADYIPWPQDQRDISLPEVWRCPNDRSGSLSNSYEPYYVQRRAPEGTHSFVLGCPRHDDSYVNLTGANLAERAASGHIQINGQSVNPDASAADRTMSTGAMTFEDGSTATVQSAGADYGVTALASFRNKDGKLYTLVRIAGDGDTDFSVTPGSRFEVITPVAIAGVRGTRFNVRTQGGSTHVSVTSGCVVVEDRSTGETRRLHAGGECTVGAGEGNSAEKLGLAWHNGKVWKATNPNSFDVTFAWQVVGGDNSGTKKVKKQKTQNFNVGDKNAQTVRITYSLPGLGTQTTVASR